MQDTRFLTYEQVQEMRDADRRHRNPVRIIAQRGGQENMLSSMVDILICGGSRGGSKSFSLMLEALRDISNGRFKSTILRANIDSLSDLVDVSQEIYSHFGVYNRSRSDMQWNFSSGAFLKFNYHDGSFDEFKIRFQGRQFSFIGVDEVTHISYEKFRYLLTCNRNASGIRNRFWGTCNPDPDSWVARFIDWWIGDDGLPLPDRNGIVRYCYMRGDEVSDIVWGSTRDEVFSQCRDEILRFYTPELMQYGRPEDIFIKSVSFVEAKLADNYQLMRSDPSYLSNLLNQPEEQRARDLEGNWKFRSVGSDMLKNIDMLRFFSNSEQIGDGVRRATCDVALEGGDRLVMWLFIGRHAKDVFSCQLNSKETVAVVHAKLMEWNVLEENFIYDENGLGQFFKGFFRRAVPFNNCASPSDDFRYSYGNLKSQVAYMFVDDVLNGNISISNHLLSLRFSGKGYSNECLSDILMKERKSIARDWKRQDSGFSLIRKEQMKRIVGHSPDWIESLYMIEFFFIPRRRHHAPSGVPVNVSSRFGGRKGGVGVRRCRIR